MYVEARSAGNANAGSIVTTCPVCGKGGTLVSIPNVQDSTITDRQRQNFFAGQRKCPNPQCNALLFFIRSPSGEFSFYPRLRIDFDSENIPSQIRSSFEEAVTCHSERCYVASAIMVRRTLEELCEDKSCTGNNLYKRIEALKSNVVLPQELFEALDEIRLLGNDAAHIESKEYDSIGKEEVGIAIELTKEILKSVYQMESLVKRLKSLKKT